jgi:hypothetical protein
MVQALRHDVCYIEFTKKDGTTRKMYATLRKDLIEEADRVPKGLAEGEDPAIAAVPGPGESVLRVLDTDLGEWRGFIIDNVTDFKVAIV